MRVLAVDLGKTSGFALQHPDGEKMSRFKDFGPADSVFSNFVEYITPMMSLIDVVVYEDPRFNRGFSYIPGLIALLTVECQARKIPMFPATVQEIKVRATGKGNATKDEMRDAAMSAAGMEWVQDQEDAIDAAWVLEWFLENAEVTPA